MDKMSRPDLRHFSRAAFSLVELLLVIAILAVLAVVALPAIGSILAGSTINRAGITATDSIQRAAPGSGHEESPSAGALLQFFLTLIRAGVARFSGVSRRTIRHRPSGRSSQPYHVAAGGSRVFLQCRPLLRFSLPTPISGARQISGLCSSASYAGFRFRPNGSVSSEINLTNNFLTLQRGLLQRQSAPKLLHPADQSSDGKDHRIPTVKPTKQPFHLRAGAFRFMPATIRPERTQNRRLRSRYRFVHPGPRGGDRAYVSRARRH